MSKKKSVLILQHILECGVLEPSDADEILPIFSQDAASTVAVTIVSSFSNNGSFPLIETEFSIEWVLQVVAYCLSLPTLYEESLNQAMTIFRYWLTSDNFFGSNEKRNKYAQRIFRYLSLVFEFENDNTHPESRRKLISTLIKDINNYQKTIGQYFDNETWEILVRVLIGCCDFLAKPQSISELADSSKKHSLLALCLSLLFDVLCNSKLTSLTIWSVFFQFTKRWCHLEDFMNSWHERITKLWETMLDMLFSNKLEKQEFNENSDEFTLIGFQLRQFIDCLDFDAVLNNSDLLKILANTVKDLSEFSTQKTYQYPGLFQPLFPADIFLGFFGNWYFKPFKQEYSPGLPVLLKSLLTITGEWYLPYQSPWTKVVLSVINEIIRKDDKRLLTSILNNGQNMLLNFASKEIIDMFLTAVNNFDQNSNLWLQFWYSFALLLLDLSEATELPIKVLQTFLDKTSVPWPTMSVLSILLKQDPIEFTARIEKMCSSLSHNKNYNPSNIRITDEPSFTFIDVITNVCYIISTSLAFINYESSTVIQPLVSTILRLLNTQPSCRKDEGLRSAFLIMVSQLTKWCDDIFTKPISVEMLDFLVLLSDEHLIDSNEITLITRMICGRSLNRSFQPEKSGDINEFCLNLSQQNDIEKDPRLFLKPLVSFMCGNTSLVTLAGDEKRSDSFVLHIRDSRGFFMWDIKDEIPQTQWKLHTEPLTLEKPHKIERNSVNSSYQSQYELFDKVLNQLKEETCVDSSYDKPTEHTEFSHIKVHKYEKIDHLDDDKLPYRLRHKAVDFLVDSGMFVNIRKIDQDVNELINHFDSIPLSSIISVPIFRGCTNSFESDENSPLLQRFISLLGLPHQFQNSSKPLPAVQLGLLTICYKVSDINECDGFVSIIFEESPLHLNLKHPSIPKCELLILVKTLDMKYYRVRCECKDPTFWCSIKDERIVSSESLSSVISETIFTFTASHRRARLYEQDKQRADLLSSVKTSPVDVLDIASDYTLNCFSNDSPSC